jgi:hypothetical protein
LTLRAERSRSRRAARALCLAAAVLLAGAAACGKKGPPLAPLNRAPEAPKAVEARRLGDTVYLRLTVPDKPAAGAGEVSIAYLEVYAATLAPGAVSPPNRDFLRPAFVIAKIPVRPPPVEDDVPEENTDKRPKPGDTIGFLEQLTPALREPQEVSKPVPAAAKPESAAPTPPPGTAPAPPAAAPATAAAPVLTRVYAVRGVAKNGAPGPASTRVTVPLLEPPAPARPGAATFDSSSVTITWQPPASSSDEAPGVTYNVYAAPAPGSQAIPDSTSAPAPLNPAPLTDTRFSQAGAAAGQERCFVVRSVATVGTAAIESEPSEPMCVTPRDIYPPAAPKGLAAVSGAGVINLIWDANTEPDLGGYIVLRGEAPGDTLQPLTSEPTRETRFADRTVVTGVTYVYAIVAVDRQTPPNQSALSAKVQETAR